MANSNNNSANVVLNVVAPVIKRNVTFYDSSTRSAKVLNNVQVTTFGDVCKLLNLSINFADKKIQEGTTKIIIESNDTVLPTNITLRDGKVTNDITIFMSPKIKMKSGMAMTYAECRAFIKDAISKDPKAKEHFNVGKNYTNKSTAELIELVASYKGVGSKNKVAQSTTKEVKSSTPVGAKSKTISEINAFKGSSTNPYASMSNKDIKEKIKDLMAKDPKAVEFFKGFNFKKTEVLAQMLYDFCKDSEVVETKVETKVKTVVEKVVEKETSSNVEITDKDVVMDTIQRNNLLEGLNKIEEGLSLVRQSGIYSTTVSNIPSQSELENMFNELSRK